MTKWKPMNAGIALLSMYLGACSVASAQSVNPILKVDEPGFLYTADPAAEVFDGKVYVYCSHDQTDARNYSSMQDYIVLESSDLKTWINHGVVLKPREYSWASGQMNAPDVAFKDGWYYFYFPYEKTHIGVAKSKSPIGPWSEAVTNKICTIFDPCVFVDDDGQAYIYGNDHKVDIGDKGWHVMGARLKPNMIELAGPWQRLSEEEVNEAVTVFKRNGKYYFMARKDKKTVYFMSDSPLPTKPYATFKGAVTEDVKGAPASTSAIEFKGQWVLFYHLGREVNNGTPCRRSVCFDKMEFNDDGTIRPVTFTLEARGREKNEVSSRAEEVMIVAHRGASRDAPQNTLPAFKLAWEQGADAIEGDKKHLGKPSPAGEAALADDVWPGAKSSFRGFDQYNFVLDGVPCKVAVPRTVAAGRPWVWRALFWGNAPQFDVAMLERGYHVVYCHVADLFGNAEAVKRWNAFYNYLRLEHLLSDRAVLEGMSRGGLIVYNWAAANPDKVQAIYADAPVMDFTSWPGGKGQGKGDARLWEACLKAYGLTEEEARAFKGHPLDNLAPLAKAGVPIIHVVGDADDVVPVAENTAIAEARYKKLGGQFEVIHKKDVGHHPHSLKNPQPIVDFVIRQHSAQDKCGHVATGSGRASAEGRTMVSSSL